MPATPEATVNIAHLLILTSSQPGRPQERQPSIRGGLYPTSRSMSPLLGVRVRLYPASHPRAQRDRRLLDAGLEIQLCVLSGDDRAKRLKRPRELVELVVCAIGAMMKERDGTGFGVASELDRVLVSGVPEASFGF